MKTILYYIRIFLFILFLISLFLLIDKLFTIKPFGSLFFITSLFYSFIMILSILSKKKAFILAISYNILSISVYLYTSALCYITTISSKLTVMNNNAYYKNNFILMIILLIGLIYYTIELNKE